MRLINLALLLVLITAINSGSAEPRLPQPPALSNMNKALQAKPSSENAWVLQTKSQYSQKKARQIVTLLQKNNFDAYTGPINLSTKQVGLLVGPSLSRKALVIEQQSLLKTHHLSTQLIPFKISLRRK